MNFSNRIYSGDIQFENIVVRYIPTHKFNDGLIIKSRTTRSEDGSTIHRPILQIGTRNELGELTDFGIIGIYEDLNEIRIDFIQGKSKGFGKILEKVLTNLIPIMQKTSNSKRITLSLGDLHETMLKIVNLKLIKEVLIKGNKLSQTQDALLQELIYLGKSQDDFERIKFTKDTKGYISIIDEEIKTLRDRASLLGGIRDRFFNKRGELSLNKRRVLINSIQQPKARLQLNLIRQRNQIHRLP